MKGQVTKIMQRETKDGPTFMITFALEDGKSARAWVVKRFGNYTRWAPIINKGKGTAVEGLVLKGKSLINADSFIKKC